MKPEAIRQEFEVAIVGGGASGTLVAIHLLRNATRPLRIGLFDRDGNFARGIAYGTPSPFHLLNVPAGRMGAFADEPSHFSRWLHLNDPSIEPRDFAPRPLYGKYLASLLEDVQKTSNAKIERLAAEVTDAAPSNDRLALTTRSGEKYNARHVVLALGNERPSNLRIDDGGLFQSDRYIQSPWVWDAVRAIDANDDVLLIGTGLTAVDAILTLVEQGHRGRIEALSRHGFLPMPHVLGREAKAFETVPKNLRALIRLVREHSVTSDWREAVDGLRPHAQTIWKNLNLPEKRRFLRLVRSYWDIHRHRMAPQIGARLDSLQAEGRLKIHAGHLQNFRLEGDGVAMTFRPRGTETLTTHRYTRVINCTGPSTQITKHESPLVRSLLEHGYAATDALNLGFDVSAGCRLIQSNGETSPWFYALGPLLRGHSWETVAIPEIRTQAKAIADDILKNADGDAQTSPTPRASPR